MLLRCPTGLTVDHAIGREILDELAGDAAQLGWRLHDRDRVVERFQVPDERARIGGLGEPPTKIIRIRGGKLVPNLRRQLRHSVGPQATVEMIMQGHLGKGAQLFTIDSHSLPLADRRRQVGGIEGTRQQVRHRLIPLGVIPGSSARHAPTAADGTGRTA